MGASYLYDSFIFKQYNHCSSQKKWIIQIAIRTCLRTIHAKQRGQFEGKPITICTENQISCIQKWWMCTQTVFIVKEVENTGVSLYREKTALLIYSFKRLIKTRKHASFMYWYIHKLSKKEKRTHTHTRTHKNNLWIFSIAPVTQANSIWAFDKQYRPVITLIIEL